MRNNDRRNLPPIDVMDGGLVMLHKVLSRDDRLKATEKNGGKEVSVIPIIIDFGNVTSIQKDYLNNGTVIIDQKTACIVAEPLEEVLDAWIEVKKTIS
ncbi:MAG: hypothetical protein J6Q22_10105 [Prevotella sp.]|nr:hypothetical protein [Prevotella sp.]